MFGTFYLKMAIESFWNPGTTEGEFNNKGGNWFADKDLEDISNALGQMSAPMLQKAIEEFGRSMSPEGRRRLYLAYRDQLMQDAVDQGGYDAAMLQSQGMSPSLRTGVALNRTNTARRMAGSYLKEMNDPAKQLQTSLGLYSSLYGMRNPESQSQGGTFLGDMIGLAGTVAAFLKPDGGGKGGKKPGDGSTSSGMSGAVQGSMNNGTLLDDSYLKQNFGNMLGGGIQF